MNRKKINLMLTCADSQVAPSIIASMKGHPLYDIDVFGCDAKQKADIIGNSFCRECFSVPLGNHADYISTIEKIVANHSIHVIVPGSDEECFSLSKHRQHFKDLGCQVTCSSHEIVRTASNKYALMKQLQSAGIPTGSVYRPQTNKDLDTMAEKLGYPDQDIVIKPISGRGSRGFKIVTSRFDPYKAFYEGIATHVTLDHLKIIFENHADHIQDFLIMEWYPGDKYSADVLVSNGHVVSMVIRNNGAAPKTNPPTQVAEIVFDSDVRNYVEKIVRLFKFDYFVQIEVGRTRNDDLGLIEANTRIDATLPITSGLGVNFFHEMITYAISGEMRNDVPDYRSFPKRLRFRRYWQHLFEELRG